MLVQEEEVAWQVEKGELGSRGEASGGVRDGGGSTVLICMQDTTISR